eukprot:SAG22_NODE_360_length_11744_cov_37.781623_6_plen_294_part_00
MLHAAAAGAAKDVLLKLLEQQVEKLKALVRELRRNGATHHRFRAARADSQRHGKGARRQPPATGRSRRARQDHAAADCSACSTNGRPDKRTKVSGHRSPPGPGSLAAGGAVVGHIPAWAAGMPRNGGGRAAVDQPAKRSVAVLTVGLRAGAVPRHRAAGAGRGGRWLHGAAGGGAPGRAGVSGGLRRGGCWDRQGCHAVMSRMSKTKFDPCTNIQLKAMHPDGSTCGKFRTLDLKFSATVARQKRNTQPANTRPSGRPGPDSGSGVPEERYVGALTAPWLCVSAASLPELEVL